MSARQVRAARPAGVPAPQQGTAEASALTTRDLARRVRASRVLTPALRRYWLALLPHLEPADRVRLDAILRDAPAPPLPPAR